MKFDQLTFVGTDTSGDFPKPLPWNPKRTGNYSEDCAAGREYFRELHQLMLISENPTFLLRVLSAQVQGGTWGGVEIGFSQAMSEKIFLA
ncbi:hypothetical protein [Mesorhizobium sp. B2-1-2]|uniref:hypothetical protein n=1 Tax=Mesorhizobium sp. B2-1-2 TaxID=2589973 RepID=UPI00112BCA3C|nr:hypothetical protein [Mesorhizobium sp. B2-1-2]TPN04524.1 hypothetical protein FJ971_29720 [Mesorhizobium sp. B2-1-2]